MRTALEGLAKCGTQPTGEWLVIWSRPSPGNIKVSQNGIKRWTSALNSPHLGFFLHKMVFLGPIPQSDLEDYAIIGQYISWHIRDSWYRAIILPMMLETITADTISPAVARHHKASAIHVNSTELMQLQVIRHLSNLPIKFILHFVIYLMRWSARLHLVRMLNTVIPRDLVHFMYMNTKPNVAEGSKLEKKAGRQHVCWWKGQRFGS